LSTSTPKTTACKIVSAPVLRGLRQQLRSTVQDDVRKGGRRPRRKTSSIAPKAEPPPSNSRKPATSEKTGGGRRPASAGHGVGTARRPESWPWASTKTTAIVSLETSTERMMAVAGSIGRRQRSTLRVKAGRAMLGITMTMQLL
jgi:hypothetical protein